MQGLAAITFPLVLMLIALLLEKLENHVMRDSGAISPDQMDSLFNGRRPAKTKLPEVAEISVLPTTAPTIAPAARRAS